MDRVIKEVSGIVWRLNHDLADGRSSVEGREAELEELEQALEKLCEAREILKKYQYNI
ncbi:MAG: hypothetical protein PHE77_01275 [Candidatus Pacebacteria bacterium]|nr:hypothetical protein [Candidatus Paceibacterota bacterium]